MQIRYYSRALGCDACQTQQVFCSVMYDTVRQVSILFQDRKHGVERPTILYMPHCDLKLYENIIGANWSEEQLARIIFVANRFSDYTDNYPQSKLEVESPYLMRLVPHLECHPLPTLECFSSAFNNISVQHVRHPIPLSLVPLSRSSQ